MIVCAALRYPGGPIICGARHFDHVMQQANDLPLLLYKHGKPEQGFIDQNGDFIDRKNAWIEAEKCGQIKHGNWGVGTLYSENLY